MTVSRKERRVMSQVETVRMGILLAEHVELVPKKIDTDAQLCRYKDDWDDDKIAAAVASDLTSSHASNLRTNLYGRLFVKPGDEKEERIEFLEKKIEQLCSLLEEFIGKHDKVCAALALNKVVDVRHLTMAGSFKEFKGA